MFKVVYQERAVTAYIELTVIGSIVSPDKDKSSYSPCWTLTADAQRCRYLQTRRVSRSLKKKKE